MIKLDINIGDEILVGKFKNKRIKVKSIGKDDYGNPTINGQSILKIRVPKLYESTIKESSGIFKDYVKIQPGYFKEFKDNYLKLNKDNVVVLDKASMKKLDTDENIYVGLNKKKRELHWRYNRLNNRIYVDDVKTGKLALNLINFFDKVKDIHPWK